MLAAPVIAAPHPLSASARRLRRLYALRLFADADACRQAEPPLRLPLRSRRVPLHPLLAPCRGHAPARLRPALRRLGARRGLCRRPDHALRLLGNAGAHLRVPDPRARHGARLPRQHALSSRAGALRRGASRRHPGLEPRDRLDRLRRRPARRARRLAHLRGRRHQVRLPARPQLDHRRLSGSDADRHRLPERLHHQGRRLCAGAGVPRRRGAHLYRRRDDALPDLLRRHRERPPPRALLLDDQPDRLHGLPASGSAPSSRSTARWRTPSTT